MTEEKKRVIIIDDEEPIREILASAVNNEGLLAAVCANGREALELLQAGHDDLLLAITDIKMPVMDGLQFIREAKKIVPELPFIIASGYGTKRDVITALQLGASDYLEKPFRLRDVVAAIRKIRAIANENLRTAELYQHFAGEKIVFRLGNDLELVPVLVRELIREVKKLQTVARELDLSGIHMALHETVINAIEHGNLELSSRLKEKPDYLDLVARRAATPPYADRQVTVTMTMDPDAFTCEVADEGPGFDWRSLPDPRNPENLFKPHGRGLILIANYFDEVKFNERGNTITLTKRLR
ncbi:MAG: ATP-binding protein [Deltaproteobacteria bacterium]|jgi:YesN/AraC family two-component response regulator|nr:ATP-binding protein [Deltaproteobacteria bacterium]